MDRLQLPQERWSRLPVAEVDKLALYALLSAELICVY